MKKIVLMAAFLVSGLSMISCTAEAIEDSVPNQATVSADGEPATTPVVVPPPPPPKP